VIEFNVIKIDNIGTNIAYNKIMLKIAEEILLQKRRTIPKNLLTKKGNSWNVNLHSRAMNSFLSFNKRRGRKGVMECENY